MKQEEFTVLFFIKKSSILKNGEAPIGMRITINGVPDEIRIQRSVPLNLWDQSKQRSKGKDKKSIELNDFILALTAKARDVHKELTLIGAFISPSYILESVFNTKDKRTVLTTMKTEIKDMEDRIGKDYEKVTINRYWNCFRSVEKCILQFYKKEDIVFPELSKGFIKHLDKYLRVEKNLCQNTIVRYMKCFKKFINMAKDEGWLKHDPFAGIKYKQDETDVPFITLTELKTIINKHFQSERLELVKNLFLFSCFTGLAYSDAKELSKTEIFTDNEGKSWIRKSRHKMRKDRAKCTSNVPLLEPALQILKLYENHPKCLDTGLCLPLYCNQIMNASLKEIASICEINKNLTTHVARHTFGTTVTLANKVALSNVSKMMGHTSTRMTERYAKVLDASIMDDMKKVDTKLAI